MVIIILFILIIPFHCYTQVADDLNFIIQNNQFVTKEKDQQSTNINREISELKLFAISLIRCYQMFISSQQDNKKICIFTPSCSRFGLAAIKKYGIIYGTLMTSDRLQRCNNLGIKNYQIDIKTGKFFDPVDHYYHKIF
jgi:putative component of membrane protein insertase Oxa1/YidC/SpoIIIJ protein YidD